MTFEHVPCARQVSPETTSITRTFREQTENEKGTWRPGRMEQRRSAGPLINPVSYQTHCSATRTDCAHLAPLMRPSRVLCVASRFQRAFSRSIQCRVALIRQLSGRDQSAVSTGVCCVSLSAVCTIISLAAHSRHSWPS